MMGNDAIAYGALGRRLPLHGRLSDHARDRRLEWMAKYLPAYGGVAVQAEDELAAINMIIGAAFTGVRSMTATSGPGLSLMTEGIGLAGSLEIPIVIVECARAGPSTGLPTKTEQSNLNHMIFGGHGEIPKIVIAPGTVEESFYMAIDAMNLAEKYQCPGVLALGTSACARAKRRCRGSSFDAVEVDRGKLVTRSGRLRRIQALRVHRRRRIAARDSRRRGRHASRSGLRAQRRRRDHGEPQEPRAHDGKAHAEADLRRPRSAQSEPLQHARRARRASSATAATAARSPRRRTA